MSTIYATQIFRPDRAMIQAMAKTNESQEPLTARQERIRRNLAKFIEESGYSVTEVADMAGIAQASLGRWVRGDVVSIPADALQPLADALGRASIDDFNLADPPRQRTKAELALAQPIYSKSRPGYEPTEEDIADFQEYLRKVQARRDKKKTKR